jgi:hypothetical protein
MKKVALFVCHDLVGLLMLNGIVAQMHAIGLSPVIFNTTTHRNKNFKVPSPRLVAAFNVSVLEGVVLPFLEKDGGRILSCKQLAQKFGGEYHEVSDINAAEVVQKITTDPEIIGAISMRFLQVFTPETIAAINSNGFLWNLHSGLLPDYKGLLLPYRAIENGEKNYGVTLHETAAGIDEGAILDTAALPLDKSKPVMELYMDTVDAAVGITVKALDAARQGFALPKARQSGGGKYYSNPTEQEFASFVQKGFVYVDPLTTIKRISDAFTSAGTFENERLTAAIHSFIGTQQAIERSVQTDRKIV